VKKPRKLKQLELEEYASKVMRLDEQGESFMHKINRLFMEAGASLGSSLIPVLATMPDQICLH
jgi:hypothetical protein